MAGIILSKSDVYGTNDANEMTTNGCYAINGNNGTFSNLPSSFGMLIVFNPEGNEISGAPILQFFCGSTGVLSMRIRWAGTWKTWAQL